MGSLIPDFEYDIFISYRQKDNRQDGWVTEFVKQLRVELGSTFKEDISVYFDSNPKDGLLETHDVDASLKDKLRCLIFIPVISRTYCDENSFAWKNEFLTFIDQASKDSLGLKVRLPGGNVSSRVLPVQIHEIDPKDKKLIEDNLGGYLRGIEFIYKSPGVNRPLLSKEDNPSDNLNKTNYRDQINKVANAIKEIIDGLQNKGIKGVYNPDEKTEEKYSYKIKNKTGILISSVFLLAIIIVSIFFIPKFLGYLNAKKKSIAVLPFHNYSEEPGQEYVSDGLTDEIINHLYKVKSFDKVVSLSSVMTYKGSNLKIPQIANDLKVNYILDGSYKKIGDKVRINVQLVDPRKDKCIWQNDYDKSYDEIISIQADIALQISDQLKAFMTGSERQNIQNAPVVDREAYNLYQQGRYFWNKRNKENLLKSIEFYEKSISIDPGFALAYAGLADTYSIMVFWNWFTPAEGFSKAKEYALKALNIDNDLAEAHAILGDIMIWSDWNWDAAEKELKLAVELNPNCGIAHQYYSELLDIKRENKEAREQIDFALQLDPVNPVFYTTSALYYCNEGKFAESINEGLKTLELNPDFARIYPLCIYSYLRLGQESKAIDILKKSLLQDTLTRNFVSSIDIIYEKSGMTGIFTWLIEAEKMKPNPSYITIAWINSAMGRKNETLSWLEKAFSTHASDLPRINNYVIFNDLRSDPRFEALISHMGLSKFSRSDTL